MTREEELLFEQVLSAYRARGVDGAVKSHPAWHDLDQAARRQAFEETLRLRRLEAALDPHGHSTTVKALLARLNRR
jgi:hypothetical protein